jgi:putative transposase
MATTRPKEGHGRRRNLGFYALGSKNFGLKRLDRIFTDHPVYGSRRLQVALLREGISVGRRRVRRLMKKLGLWAVRPKRNTSKRHPEHKVYPYLLRGKTIDQPNQSLPSRKRGCGQLT